MTLVSIEVVFYSKKFETVKFLAVFNFTGFELMQMLRNKRKSHRLTGGFLKWWGIARYLRTNTDELRELAEKINNLTFKQ